MIMGLFVLLPYQNLGNLVVSIFWQLMFVIGVFW